MGKGLVTQNFSEENTKKRPNRYKKILYNNVIIYNTIIINNIIILKHENKGKTPPPHYLWLLPNYQYSKLLL